MLTLPGKITFVLALMAPILSKAQSQIRELPNGYLMTIAAYRATGEGYAQRYVNQLKNEGIAADYGYTYKKNMYFVYTEHYTNYPEAIAAIAGTRKNTPFSDAWVYAYEAESTTASTTTSEPATMPIPAAAPNKELPKTDSAHVEITIPVTTKDSIAAEVPAPIKSDGSRLIYFEAVEARTQDPVDVEITFFDPFSERVITTMRTAETQRVKPPTNKEGILRVKTSTFGWVGDAVNINFNNPITDSTEYFLRFRGDTLVVFFDMHRMRKGDIQTLYNVYFIPDASLVRPESKYELDLLRAMLEENPTMRIALHGHTNGSSNGVYYRLAEGDTLFFALNRKHEKTNGSSKQLSYDRANTVKQYLVYKGIAEDRIEVKGWGGRRMIYDENSMANKRNIRVEVEVLNE